MEEELWPEVETEEEEKERKEKERLRWEMFGIVPGRRIKGENWQFEETTKEDPVYIYVDGSAKEIWEKTEGEEGDEEERRRDLAGWGVAISTEEGWIDRYGEVNCRTGDRDFWGADRKTNNTGELSAMIETLVWLRKTKSARGKHFVIYYDSEYAAKMTQGIWKPTENKALINTALRMLAGARGEMNVRFRYIKAHTNLGDKHSMGNQRADVNAKKGARGRGAAF